MAYLNICGFETGDLSEVAGSAGTVSVQATTKRTGGYALRINPSAASGYVNIGKHAADGTNGALTLGAAGGWSTLYVRFATFPSSSVHFLQAAAASNGTSRVAAVHIDNGGAVTLVGTTTSATVATLSTDTWYRIDFRFLQNGTCGVKVNDGAETTVTGNNFASTHFLVGNVNINTWDAYVDDIAVSDSAYPGAGQVNILKPRAAGASAQWATGTSALYSAVNEVPHNSDTTYIGSATSGNASSFAMDSSATAGVVGTIAVVKTIGIFRDEGGVSSMSVRLRNGTTNRDTTAVDPGAAYAALARMDATDPNTAAAWTSGGLDTCEAGAVNSAAVAARCTALYAMVWCDGVVPFTTRGIIAVTRMPVMRAATR